jgi:UDP-2,3-diacylglucosamine pyrophosphatase LpxH
MGSCYVVGDLHVKQQEILPVLEKRMETDGVARVVFVGDYCDDWSAGPEKLVGSLEFQRDWAIRLREKGVEVVFLVGNHDIQYLMHTACSGTDRRLYGKVDPLLDEIGLALAHVEQGYLVTHAGLTHDWAHEYLDLPLTVDEIADVLNDRFESRDPIYLEEIASAGYARGGWGLPGPLWADKRELELDPLEGVDQIVGHTPVVGIEREKRGDSELVFCDTFSTRRDGRAIGNGQIVFVEHGIASPVDLFEGAWE